MTDLPVHRPAAGTPPPPPQIPEVVQRARALFGELDRNHDGQLTKQELKDTLQTGRYAGRDAAAVVTLISENQEISELHRDRRKGISQADLTAYAAQPEHPDVRFTEGAFERAVRRADTIKRDLLPEGLASITPSAVRQGSIGVCYFLSAVAGMAATNPQRLRDMITANDDGSYTVRFAKKTVTVPPLTDAEYARGSGTPQGNWVTVLEAAFMQMHPKADRGGLAGGIRALTGHHSDMLPLVGLTGLDRIRETIADAQADGRLMTVSRTWTKTGKEEFSLNSGHVYTVMGYDPATDEVLIRDPHGREGPQADGCQRFRTAEFRRLFDLMAIERD
jgi:hypothetical protein